MSRPPTEKVLRHYEGLLMKNSTLSFSWHACFAFILLSPTLWNHIKRICEHAAEFIWKNSWRWKGICCFKRARGLSHGDLPSRTPFVLEEGRKGLNIQVICWERWLHLVDYCNSDGVMIMKIMWQLKGWTGLNCDRVLIQPRSPPINIRECISVNAVNYSI